MKKENKQRWGIAFILVCIFCTTNLVYGQNMLSNERILEVANKIYKSPQIVDIIYEYVGEPVISTHKTVMLAEEQRLEIKNNPNNRWNGFDNGEEYYIVTYYYDKKKYTLDEKYVAKIYVKALDGGKAFYIEFWHRIGVTLKNGEIPDTVKSSGTIKYYTITYSDDLVKEYNFPKTEKIRDRTIKSFYYRNEREYGWNYPTQGFGETPVDIDIHHLDEAHGVTQVKITFLIHGSDVNVDLMKSMK